MPKTLEELRAQARTVASRMEARITTAIEANREMTAEETTANEADEAELAGLKSQITAAEAGSSDDGSKTIDPAKAATDAERTRILALADLCPSSVLATPLRKAIADGVDAGAFAIGLATAAKQRGASMDDLRAGAVQPGQLPNTAGAKDGDGKTKPLTGAARGAAIVARAAAMGHSALSHLAPKG